jgi:poly(U)-specific endoribonuclease
MGRDFNDLGYIEAVETGKTTIISIPVDLSGSTEAASQLNAIGTSPELDPAMGTLCFIA